MGINSKLQIFDSKTHQIVPFVPNNGDKVGIYVCGPTVQSSPHIGHMRVAVAFDIIRRWLINKGYDVNFVQNVTDIDDKILRKANEQNISWKALAKKYEAEFNNAYQKLNVMSPTINPHATKYISQQIKFVQKIFDAGYAYQTVEENGNVWFNTEKFKEYGSLTKQCFDENLVVSDEDKNSEKKNPRDFAIWKAVSKNDPDDAVWGTPWGKGRPGWHLECSAMASGELGDSFEIHGGGLDLRFPHHENELAQNRSVGQDFAKYWMHSAWVTSKGEKMSKSLGNGLSVESVLETGGWNIFGLRYALSVVHYRSMIEWTDNTLKSSITTGKRIKSSLDKVRDAISSDEINDDSRLDEVDVSEGFSNALDDDFNVSKAISVTLNNLKHLVKQIASNLDLNKALYIVSYRQIRNELSILGFDLHDDYWGSILVDSQEFSDDELKMIEEKIKLRNQAKLNKNYQEADQIRDELLKEGIQLVDDKDGTKFIRL